MPGRSTIAWLIVIVFLGMLIGVVGGGLMGGLVGFYVVTSRSPMLVSAGENTRVVSAQPTGQPPAVTNLTLKQDSAIIETVKRVEPAVVTVINNLDTQSDLFGQLSPQSSGSGVIIDEQGHIVTNNHVVEGARQLEVVFSDGSKAEAQVVGTDPVTDLAVIKVNARVPAFAPLGDSNALQLGETVVAIGSPLGSYRGSVTVGVVSGLNRRVQVAQQEGLIQTDAAINHGNSGGPLVNLAGQIVGINTLVVRDTTSGDIAEGLGFSIPSNTVRDVSQQLIAVGKVEYPYIGIRYQEITPELATENRLPVRAGLLVVDVTPGSPAANAGLRQNDIITALDNNAIDEEHSLRSLLFKYKVGDQVTLQLVRGGQTSSVTLTLVARPPE